MLFYGHFWIAAAALAMSAQTRYLYTGSWSLNLLDGFIAAGTLTIYALHRLVGLRMQANAQARSRYQVMWRFRKHIIIYAVLAGIAATYYFFQLSPHLRWWLLFPCIIALTYVLPLLNGRRLRDLPYVKIFLIALSWAWLTVFGPVWEAGGSAWALPVLLMAIERGAFIFAITIPFDIRDLSLDAANRLDTLPGVFGVQIAKRWAYVCLLIMALAIALNAYLGTYALTTTLMLILSTGIAAGLVYLSHAKRHDYFYTGLIDGVMIVQALLVWTFV